MIRALVEQTFDQQKKYFVLAGSSSDTKPTSGLITGSEFHEVDTGTKYEFDEASSTWNAVGLTPDEIKAEIDAWLDDHPEATTTVQDGAITYAKLDASLQQKADDVSSLKSAIFYGATLASSKWEIGGFVDATGDTNTSNTRLHTAGYIPREFTFVTPSSGYDVIAYGWSNGTYLGAWQGSSFAKSGVAWKSNVDLNAVYAAGATDVKIAARKQNNGTMSTSDGETYNFDASNIKKLTAEVSEINSIYPVKNGYVNRTNGELSNSDQYRRTDLVAVESGFKYYFTGRTYYFAAGAAYDSDGAYIDALLPDGGSGTTYTNYLLTLPANTAYIAVCSLPSVDLELKGVTTIQNTVEALISADGELSNRIDGLNNYVRNEWELTTPSLFERIGVCGDSYSAGAIYGVPGTATAHYSISWPEILGRRNGITGIPYAYIGASAGGWLVNENGLLKLKADTPCNLYIIALGINSEDVGSIDDVNDADPTQNANTYYGNMARIYHEIHDFAPNAKIIYARMPMISSEKATAMQTLAARYSIPYMPLSSDAFFDTDFYADNKATSHPLAVSNAGMALAVERQLCKVMVNNSSYFADYVGND